MIFFFKLIYIYIYINNNMDSFKFSDTSDYENSLNSNSSISDMSDDSDFSMEGGASKKSVSPAWKWTSISLMVVVAVCGIVIVHQMRNNKKQESSEPSAPNPPAAPTVQQSQT